MLSNRIYAKQQHFAMRFAKVIRAISWVLLLPVALSAAIAVLISSTSQTMPSSKLPSGPYTGDDLIPDAVMVYDQTRAINAAPSAVWPWVLQVGKGRGGWYLPRSWERKLPSSFAASRTIESKWQGLAVGDRVDDYGFSAEDYFDVAIVDRDKALVYRSDRYGAFFSWALLLHPVRSTETGGVQTILHLRFRGRIAATGLKRKLLVWGGGVMDHLTTAPMLAGLAERAEKDHVQ